MRFSWFDLVLVGGALLCWAASIPLSRILGEILGPWHAGAVIYIGGGLVGLTATLTRSSRKRSFGVNSWRVLVLRSVLFSTYCVALYGAVNSARTVEQVAVVSALNYTWPVLTAMMGAWVLDRAAVRWGMMMGGAALCLAGVASVRLAPSSWESVELIPGYGVMLIGSCAWALYSVLQGKAQIGAGWVFVYMLVTGALCGIVAVSFEHNTQTGGAIPVWVWPMILAPAGGYLLWELGTRRCGAAKAGILANSAPLLSTIALVVLLNHPINTLMFIGAGLLTVGGYVSKRSLTTQ